MQTDDYSPGELELEQYMNAKKMLDRLPSMDKPAGEIKPTIKAKVVSHSRDYLTLEFIGNEPKQFEPGQVVSVSKE